jgi:hypothetical protein
VDQSAERLQERLRRSSSRSSIAFASEQFEEKEPTTGTQEALVVQFTFWSLVSELDADRHCHFVCVRFHSP